MSRTDQKHTIVTLDAPAQPNQSQQDESTALIAPQQNQPKLSFKQLKKVIAIAGLAAETILPTAGLSQRWFYQLITVLKNEGVVLTKETLSKLNHASPGIPVALGLWALYQEYKHKNDALPAGSRDKIRALFSSGFIFIVADTLLKEDQSFAETMSIFALSTIVASTFSLYFASNTVSTTARRPIWTKSEAEYLNAQIPAEERSTGEKMLNAITQSIEYGMYPLVADWMLQRELSGATQPASMQSQILAGVTTTAAAVAGYKMTERPKTMDRIALTARTVSHTALSYAAMSGFMMMVMQHICDDEELRCLNDDATRAGVSAICATMSLMVGAFTATHSGLRHNAIHEDNQQILHSVGKVGNFAKNCWSFTKDSVRGAGRNIYALFDNNALPDSNDVIDGTELVRPNTTRF